MRLKSVDLMITASTRDSECVSVSVRLKVQREEVQRENQTMSMRNLGLELVRFHHSNKYK